MKMRIDEIKNLSDLCTGCMACVDACPKQCIQPVTRPDGFRYAEISDVDCVCCGKCFAVCPIETHSKNTGERHLYAAYAQNDKTRNNGSSGGVFELLARHFLSQGYVVCGAAFDGTVLRHRIIHSVEELLPLLKSKYVQSDTTGIYREIISLLKEGGRLFFCGTPCQVSALKNSVPENLQERLVTADIICHGVPSQKTFDRYICALEEKENGKVRSFSFRVKNNKYRHAHGFSYCLEKDGEEKTIDGIYLQSSYYTAFKKYLFFRESCYTCRYATLDRVSDITLGDFWGIEKYPFPADSDKGVSMIISNTSVGEAAFEAVASELVWREFPVEYGVESNYCLTKATRKPAKRDAIIKSLNTEGYESTARAYFGCTAVEKIYASLPPAIRNLRKKLRKR